MRPVPGCDGRGHIPVDAEGMTMRMCRNMYLRSLHQHLGPEISRVQHVPVSPLFERGKVDRTGDNLFLTGCAWRELLPHIKLALACKGLMFTFRIVDDQQIKNVFVGNEHRKVRLAGQAFHNSLADFLGDDAELVIIRLGFMGYKNIAAAGALKEALLIRESLRLATWVFEDSEHPWVHSRDMDVEHYIKGKFETIAVEGADPGYYNFEPDDMGSDPDPEEGALAVARPSPVYNDLANSEFSLPGDGRGRYDSRGDEDDGMLGLPGEKGKGRR